MILIDQTSLYSDFNASRVLETFDIPTLKEKLLNAAKGVQGDRPDIDQDTLEKFRLAVMSLSIELSKRGVAPRWQGLVKWRLAGDPGRSAGSVDPVFAKAIQADSCLYDLYWLWAQYRKQIKAKIPKWSRLFSADEFNIELAVAISKVKLRTARKVMELRLDEWQQIGCLVLIRKDARKIIESAAKKHFDVNRLEADQLSKVPNLNHKKREEIARLRADA